MSNQNFYSCHLHLEPNRQEQFRMIRRDIEEGKGSQTISLEFVQPIDRLGEINFGSPIFSRSTFDSGYLISVGLQTYRLKYGSNRIGRFDDNDIVIDDIYVSRRHCCIVVHSNGRAELFDTASKNHTWVNGVQVDRCWLKSSDEIRLARTCPLIITLEE
ncbi:MAG: FHA domain-containing protein [Acidobacteriota bacterium]